MLEYDLFQKGVANGNRNTKILEKQLYSDAPDSSQLVDKFMKNDMLSKTVKSLYCAPFGKE